MKALHRPAFAAAIAGGLAALAVAAPGQAAPVRSDGGLDATFAPGGGVTLTVPNVGLVTTEDAAVQRDGKVVAVGTGTIRCTVNCTTDDRAIVLARYDPATHALDPGFGQGGTTVDNVARNGDPAAVVRENVFAVRIQPDGKIVVAGWASVPGVVNRTFMLARYDERGVPDASFGDGGHVLVPLRTANAAGDGTIPVDVAQGFDVAIQPDGRIVVAGDAFVPFNPLGGEPTGFANVALARYMPDGTLDASFGQGGVVARDSVPGSAQAVRVQPDGKIVVAGRTPGNGFLVARYLPDGSVDRGFGTNGSATADFGVLAPTASASALVVQRDGTIVATGKVEYLRRDVPGFRFDDAGVLALNPDGTPATRFDGDGVKLVDLERHRAFNVTGLVDNRPLLSLRAGSIVIGGTVLTEQNELVGKLARVLPDGTLDAQFGVGGVVTTHRGSGLVLKGLVAQPDGKLVAVGDENRAGPALLRYRQDAICTSISCLRPPLGPQIPPRGAVR